MESPEKEMADKEPSLGTGIPSLVITGDPQGPTAHTVVGRKAVQVMEDETKTFARLAFCNKEVN